MLRTRLTPARLITILALLLTAIAAAATEPVLLSQERFRVNALLHADYLVDPDQKLDVGQLQRDDIANRFTPVHQQTLRGGFAEGGLWLRLALTNPDGQNKTVNFLVEGHANHRIRVFYPTDAGRFASVASGAGIALENRPEPLGNYVLPVPLAPGTQELYVRLESIDPLNTRILLLDRSSLQTSLAGQLALHSGLTALQLVLLALGAALALHYRQPALAWALLAGLGLTAFNAGWNGFVSHLLPGLPYVDIHARNAGALAALLGLTGLTAALRRERLAHWLNETLRWAQRALALLCAIALLPAALGLSPLLLTLVPVTLTALGLLWVHQRDTRQRHETWALLGFATFGILFLLVMGASAGVLLSVPANATLLHLVSLGVMLAVLRSAYDRARHRDAGMAVEGLDLPSLHWPLMRKLNHEMRGPINGVLGMAELLQDTSLSAHQQEYVNTVQAAGFSLLRQADQLQNLVRIGLNRLPEGEDEFDLYDLLEDAIQPYSRLAHAKQLELVMDVAPELPTRYLGNAQIIAQVLSNLLDNALNYTDHGEVLVQVKPWNNHRIRFSVTDTGPGLPKDLKGRLFDFPSAPDEDQLSPREVYLGLPITRVLVSLLGGHISFSSELRMGTTFWVDLPLPEVVDSGEVDVYSTGDLADIRLMVVDDNLTCRKVIEHLGMSWGMAVFSMSNGQSALANLHNEFHKGTPVDVLVLDQNMPGMTGTELAERIRSDEALNRDILIIMLTGVDVGQADLDESRLDIRYLLTKPVSGRALKQTLMQAMPDILHNREHHHAKKSLFF